MNGIEKEKIKNNPISNFYVKKVAISFDNSKIKRIRIDGYEDISEHEKVLKEYDDGGKLVEIQGTLEYKEAKFSYLIGHTIGQMGSSALGHIKITKNSEKTDEELLYELNEIFLENYFEIFKR